MEAKTSVLIVDDNISLAKTLSLILIQKGFDAITANSGSEALELVSTKPEIDVVLMDIKMPIMNGVETFKKMKEKIPNATVIMMTAYAVEDLIQEAIREGAYGVIHKPIDIEDSIRLIENAKEKRDGAFILIVDDDSGSLITFKNILIKKGYKVLTSTDGDEAIDIATQNNFDIIFLDLKLPTINGFETYLKIRESKPDVITVLITGHFDTMEDTIRQALLSSVYTCLRKPLDMPKVLTLIDELIEMRLSGGRQLD